MPDGDASALIDDGNGTERNGRTDMRTFTSREQCRCAVVCPCRPFRGTMFPEEKINDGECIILFICDSVSMCACVLIGFRIGQVCEWQSGKWMQKALRRLLSAV